jgi:hypothetical protein
LSHHDGVEHGALRPRGHRAALPDLSQRRRSDQQGADAPPDRFDHVGITAACITCHNGVTATGKPPGHIPSSNTCGDCHTTVTWTGAVFDHTGITTNCATCHNGVTATGKPANHIPTSQGCESCHSTLAWIPASFDHTGVTSGCATCHNGVQATGKPGTHFITQLGCETCHSTTQWVPDVFRHTSPNYPGAHRTTFACTACHTANSQSPAFTFAAYAPACAGCHANNYTPDPHTKVISPAIRYTVSELRDCSGACHIYTDSTFTQIQTMRSGHHRITDASFN